MEYLILRALRKYYKLQTELKLLRNVKNAKIMHIQHILEAVDTCLEYLDDIQKDVLMMIFAENKTLQETAEILNISISTAKRKKKSALKKLEPFLNLLYECDSDII